METKAIQYVTEFGEKDPEFGPLTSETEEYKKRKEADRYFREGRQKHPNQKANQFKAFKNRVKKRHNKKR